MFPTRSPAAGAVRTAFVLPTLATGLMLLAAQGAGAQTIERVKLTDNDLSCQQIYAEAQQMETAMQLAGPGLPPPPAPAASPQPVPQVQQQALAAALPTQSALQGAVMMDPKVQASIARARASGMSEAQINATIGLGMQRGGLGTPTLAQMHAPSAALMTQQGVSQEYQNEYARAMAQAQAGNRGAVPAIPAVPAAPVSPAAAGLAGLFGALAAGAAAPRAAPAVTAAAAPAPQAGLGAQAKARKDHLTGLFLSKGCRMADVQN